MPCTEEALALWRVCQFATVSLSDALLSDPPLCTLSLRDDDRPGVQRVATCFSC